MIEIELLKPQNLKTPNWRTTFILKVDLLGLRNSIKTFGVLQPIVTMEDGTIIDGNARWTAAHDLGLKEVPVIRTNLNKAEAILLHVQMNRCRGNIVTNLLGSTIRTLMRVMDEQEIMNALSMSADEFDVLSDGTLIKKREVFQHNYNKAWVPVESSASEDFHIDRPPTPDK